ncbi:Ribosomal RNA small subunit methyltransferase D [Saezia sanguinis]|uniref:Ribosomal RNA small subunit methyltransferase D n=1 Tax=Saezia sanguinis TaxID=1965230 RepID=A0A433SDZ5_9BURK|nr:Ribosomal RNA small subunit methyltransferase D [Saezia sanguinis]
MAGTVKTHHSKPQSRPAVPVKRRLGSAPGEVRIVGGQWKRTKLPVMDMPGLRPTPSRVRETLFNWLGQDLSGWRCLDVFAGTGALGFEAASRGAAHVTLVEKDKRLAQHLQLVRQKLEAANVEVLCGDGMAALTRCEAGKVDLVFLDPPFAADLFENALVQAQRVVSPDGAIYLEADRLIEPPKGLSCYRQARAGAVYYHLFIPGGAS